MIYPIISLSTLYKSPNFSLGAELISGNLQKIGVRIKHFDLQLVNYQNIKSFLIKEAPSTILISTKIYSESSLKKNIKFIKNVKTNN